MSNIYHARPDEFKAIYYDGTNHKEVMENFDDVWVRYDTTGEKVAHMRINGEIVISNTWIVRRTYPFPSIPVEVYNDRQFKSKFIPSQQADLQKS